MPFYQYWCEENGQTVEVCHPARIRLGTWAAVCLLARRDPGTTPGDAPVQRLVSRARPFVPKLSGLDADQTSGKLEL